MLPEIDIGDLIYIHDTGAHGSAMGYNYNGKLRSARFCSARTAPTVSSAAPRPRATTLQRWTSCP